MFKELNSKIISSLIYIVVLLLLVPFVKTLNEPPEVECLEDAMRLHFTPDFPSNGTDTKFCGHIYVKGFFFSSRCHLDFTRVPVDQPLYFHIPYKSDCQVRRERLANQSLSNGFGSGFLYSTVILVQHHRLFVTERDRAYSVSCFYNEDRNFFQNRLQVGELTPSQVEGVDRLPSCAYEILSASTGRPTRFANIGDQLVHRWSCDAEHMGMLVHSCFVRDDIGSEFALLDDRGCVTDESLMEPLIYAPSLNETYSPPVGAFKFADQMTVYFTCRITLCDIRQNGCEGITPPTCNLKSATTAAPFQLLGGRRGPLGATNFSLPISIEPNNARRTFAAENDGLAPWLRTKVEESSGFRNGVDHAGATTPAYALQLRPPTASAQGHVSDEWAPDAVNLFSHGRLFVRSNEKEPRRRRDTPAYFARTTTVRRDLPNDTTLLAQPRMTVDVTADRLIIFTNDEKIPSDTQIVETLHGERPSTRHCGDTAVLWMSAVFAVLLATSVCTFVVLHMRFRREMFALRRQLQVQRRSTTAAAPRGALPGYAGGFAPPPFFELATMMQAQERAVSRQNLVG